MLLEFAYTGQFTGLTMNTALEILDFADRFELFDVTQIIPLWVNFNISRDNVFELDRFLQKNPFPALTYSVYLFIALWLHPDDDGHNDEEKKVIELHQRRILEILHKPAPPRTPLKELSKDLFSIKLKPSNDLTFLVEEEEITVDKGLLLGRSNYFRRMLLAGFKEGSQKIVELEDGDLDARGFKNLIDYFYTGDISKLTSEEAVQLLSWSHKAMDSGLESVCREKLLKLNKEEMLDLLLY